MGSFVAFAHRHRRMGVVVILVLAVGRLAVSFIQP